MNQNPEGKSADEILAFPASNEWSWHLFQALSWLDLAKRHRSVSALQYAALEFRLAMEYLLFELLYVLSLGVSEDDYQKCLGDLGEIKKLILKCEPQYERLCAFTRISLSLQRGGPKLAFWRLGEVFANMGYASELLHFIGTHRRTHGSEVWFTAKLTRLEGFVAAIRNKLRATAGTGLAAPGDMPPEVQRAWSEYSAGKLSDDDLRLRLKLMQGVLRMRQGKAPL